MNKLLKRSAIAQNFIKKISASKKVNQGVFQGMLLDGRSVGSVSLAKYFGTYELELEPVFRDWSRTAFQTVVDVGAAEGYYAVGCALLWKSTNVIAFETEQEGRTLILGNAIMNHVDNRISIRGKCDPDDLNAALTGDRPQLVIMDVEGYEDELLNPLRVAALKTAHIMVEIHDFIDSDIAAKIAARFVGSHSIVEIWSRDRTPRDFAGFSNSVFRWFLWPYLKQFADEGRPGPMRWLVMSPLAPV